MSIPEYLATRKQWLDALHRLLSARDDETQDELFKDAAEVGGGVMGQDYLLKPCPFCGGKPKFIPGMPSYDGPGSSKVACTVCEAAGGIPLGQFLWRCAHDELTEQQGVQAHDLEAIRLWNARVGETNDN